MSSPLFICRASAVLPYLYNLLFNSLVIPDCMSIPPREEWELMLGKAERKAVEILNNYERKCKEIEVNNQFSA